MKSLAPDERSHVAELPAGNDRYEVHALIGRGGMALVYEATDRHSARRVALKRLQALADPAKQQRNLNLFEREFHTLAQLEHPRIVRVFDFGVDASGAYYTMELLEGGDLQELAPLPWRRACAIARDVCSALSLLHSRRFVHRDVSPRNVRCLQDGPAKLIDFGAMAPLGPTKLLVGTPPCCAPESVHLQSIDGRTDLFGLGATLYFLLVGRHAFPARRFGMLGAAWRAGFTRPSELVADVPEALEALVLELLRLEPDARPASAAEVMERLAAIDGESAGEQLGAAYAYLSTPTLVGRDMALARVKRRVNRATGGRSRSVVIEGPAGVGRTRFLDACLLDATLSGQTIVRADSDDAISGDYGVVRAMVGQLLELLPQLARETALPHQSELTALLPELASEAAPANDVLVPRARLQRALHAWLTSLSKRQPFVLAVDDFHRIDEPSAALIALLERDSTEHELCLLITVESGAAWTAESARRLLAPLTTLKLETLSAEESEKLLRSVFGSAPNIELLAQHLRELCAGAPRDLLRLAQHLVDREVVRYADGAWTLPRQIDVGDLPASLSDALAARIAALPEAARELAGAFALAPGDSFTFVECGRLCGSTEPRVGVALLEALSSADIVRRVDDGARLSQRSWVPLLRANMPKALELQLERRLAEAFESRPGEEFRAAQHWLRAEEPARAVERLVVHAKRSQELTSRGAEHFQHYLINLPEGWFETYRECARQCRALKRPHRDIYLILSRLSAIMGLLNTHSAELLDETFGYLRRDSGYDDYCAHDPNMESSAQLMAALARAQARFDARGEDERVLAPVAAIRDLTRAVVAAMGPISFALDVPTLRKLPRIGVFGELAPTIASASLLIEGVDARCTGRSLRARRAYAELLERIERPDRAGFDLTPASYLKLGVMNGLGVIEAGLGLPSWPLWANQLANHPAYEVNAMVIRMLGHLFQGDVTQAEHYKRASDRMRIQNTGRQMYEGGHLIWELHGHALSADLTRVRHVSEELVPMAKRHPQWVPVLRYASAEYHRMTRDYERAQSELEIVLAEVAAGSHQIWPHAASAHVLVLLELGDHERALQQAELYASSAERELEDLPDALQLARAQARAHAGQADAAQGADAVIARLERDQVARLYLGVAHEARARIALQLRDTTDFARHAELCRLCFFTHPNSALTAKYHRLFQEGQRKLSIAVAPADNSQESSAAFGATRIELALARCRDDDQRARLALTLLTRQGGATAGCLFMLGESGPACVARVGNVPDPGVFLPPLQAYLAAQSEGGDATSTQSETEEPVLSEWKDDAGRLWRPVLISHYSNTTQVITGVAALYAPGHADITPPMQLVGAISQFYADRGATSMMLLVD